MKLLLLQCNYKHLGGQGPSANLNDEALVTSMFVKLRKDNNKEVPLHLTHLLSSATPKSHQIYTRWLIAIPKPQLSISSVLNKFSQALPIHPSPIPHVPNRKLGNCFEISHLKLAQLEKFKNSQLEEQRCLPETNTVNSSSSVHSKFPQGDKIDV